MKKSNKLVYIIALVVSAFLLWLWYWLGFDHVDAPLDLVLSIIWWVLVALAAYGIHRVEKKRQERVRTCYIAGNHVFNSEYGTIGAVGAEKAVHAIHDILRDLKYNMHIADMPEDEQGNTVRYDYIVRSKVFEIKQEEDREKGQPEELEWEGEVAVVGRPEDDPTPFQSREELESTLTKLASTTSAA